MAVQRVLIPLASDLARLLPSFTAVPVLMLSAPLLESVAALRRPRIPSLLAALDTSLKRRRNRLAVLAVTENHGLTPSVTDGMW